MYEKFYSFKEKPFHLNPDHRFFFGSVGHKRALAYLNYGVRQGEGFIVITGEVGTGKTTLIYTLLEDLAKHEHIVVAHLPTPSLEGGELLPLVASAFGLAVEGVSKSVLLRQLEQFLMEQARESKRTLLIVDEAQSLTMEGLEVLRMLTNFQMNNKALLQGFLIGQAEFQHTLSADNLEQLRQRVIASCHLGPMELQDTPLYIEHRLGIVGWNGDPAFTAGAYHSIHDYTGGIPRRINKLCDRILLVGYLEETHIITRELVNSVIDELTEEALVLKDEKKEPQTPKSEQAKPGSDEFYLSSYSPLANPSEQELLKLDERVAALENIITKAREALQALMSGNVREKSKETVDWDV
ncbi:MAG: XrtA-associated ATPase [Candidatus Competibacteraceae bacterium]